ncbi:SPOR domain-containing protein [Thermaurantiacus sp.]
MAKSPSPRAEAERRQAATRGGEPWLEEADDEDPPTETLIGRRAVVWLIAALLLLVSLVAAGLFLVTGRADAPIDVPVGDIPLVTSPGPWKVPAQGPGADGVPVEGQGQIVFPTGEGLEPEAEIDPERLPEEPVPLPSPGEAPRDLLGGIGEEAALPASGAGAPPQPARPAPAPQAGTGVAAPAAPRATGEEADPAGPIGTIQLGAFSSEARARAAWKEMSGRFPSLGPFTPAFTPVEREGGQTLWRLRASGPDSQGVCNRLKIAGEECALVR